jgi:cephalosporin hydroxylase
MTDHELINAFHVLWYEQRQHKTWRNTTWLGHDVLQCPTDLWVYQELLHRVRPEVFVEIGVKRGGLTHYVASLFDLMHGDDRSTGRVVGVDISMKAATGTVGSHPRVTLIEGDSTDEGTVERVRQACAGQSAIVLLDSDHAEGHVRAELDLYNDLVPVGSYIIVNDTNVGGHPALGWKQTSPWDAVHAFVAEHPEFEIDRECEKHMLTLCPDGYLRRIH